METFIQYINYFITLLFVICYAYQFIYIPIAWFKKPVKFRKAEQTKRYAFILSARNEEAVIGNLIASIKDQTYPAELIDIFVCADNCTDNTALVARNAGATVFERFNKQRVGKGYALEYLFEKISKICDDDYYDGYFIFDADNLLDKRYVAEMNKAFCAGHRIITSYRNSKNFGTNWISAGYALWFLRDATYLNNVRMILGTSCCATGTGFLVSSEVIRENGGWKFFLLTEDIEFSLHQVLKNEKLAYCHSAKFYDEQPTRFTDSWKQRSRWAKGYLQVFKKYRKPLVKGFFGTNAFSCFDMTMTIMPALILSSLAVIINVIMLIVSLATQNGFMAVVWSCLEAVRNSAILLFFVGFFTVISEWKEIRCEGWKKILYMFTFPLFMATYVPIAMTAMVRKVKWDPIKHDDSASIDDMNKRKRKKALKKTK
ncbi:MAG: glycosyltransferase family 2 protein [Ruminococcus sp.]|nr:glycosyltransferase family 2 protein [Ruminococcus sp.]